MKGLKECPRSVAERTPLLAQAKFSNLDHITDMQPLECQVQLDSSGSPNGYEVFATLNQTPVI